jgi:ornithine cyclodeaminase/alanine dehydrogenase
VTVSTGYDIVQVLPGGESIVLLLSGSEVEKVLDMKECITLVERALAELTCKTAIMPPRINLFTGEGLALYMPAYIKGMGALACKVVTSYTSNPVKHKLPTILGKVLLQEPETGDIICMMDGAYLTAVRTGAASGVATKYLVRKDSSQTAGIFGAGVQGRAQLWAMTEVRDITRAYVYDVNDAGAEAFIADMGKKLHLEIIRAGSAPEVLQHADIVCTATSSPSPIFDGSLVREGTHLNCVGSHTPAARELDTAIITRAKIVADSLEACLREAGDILIPISEGAIKEEDIYAELGDIIIGRKEARENSQEITLFKSNGLAIQDAAAAKLVYDRAKTLEVGTEIDLAR